MGDAAAKVAPPAKSPQSALGRSGFLLVDKPEGPTSHDVVAAVRRWAGTRRVGHAGTLDPAATGLMLLGVGKATRLLGHLSLTDKTYESQFVLGQATDTDDAQGVVVAEAEVAAFLGEVEDVRLTQALAALTGTIWQIPPQVSAIKVAGQRAYARARAGLQTELKARQVVVNRLEALQLHQHGPTRLLLDVRVHCSSGTYIRSLARDLGVSLGTYGHVGTLRRTQVGPFQVEDAWPLSQLRGENPVGLEQALLPLAQVASQCLPTLHVDSQTRQKLVQGMRIPLDQVLGQDREILPPTIAEEVVGPPTSTQATAVENPASRQIIAVLDESEQLVALAQIREKRLCPQAVLV